jgi:hypothetical protein
VSFLPWLSGREQSFNAIGYYLSWIVVAVVMVVFVVAAVVVIMAVVVMAGNCGLLNIFFASTDRKHMPPIYRNS